MGYREARLHRHAVPFPTVGRALPAVISGLSESRLFNVRPVNPEAMMPLSILALASYFKGNRFLERLKAEGATLYLLTVEKKLTEPWARHACDEVFAVNNFADRRALINAVAY